MNCIFFSSFSTRTGWSITSTASRTRLSRVNSANRTNAIMVLGVLSPSRECLSSVLEDITSHPFTIDPQGKRRCTLQRAVFKNWTSTWFEYDSRCVTIRIGGLQCSIVACNGFKYSRSSIMFTNSCTNAHATLSFTVRPRLNWSGACGMWCENIICQ